MTERITNLDLQRLKARMDDVEAFIAKSSSHQPAQESMDALVMECFDLRERNARTARVLNARDAEIERLEAEIATLKLENEKLVRELTLATLKKRRP